MPRTTNNTLEKKLATRRRAALRSARRQKEFDALLITNLHDLRYLTGITEGAGSLLVADKFAAVVTSYMFKDAVAQQCPGCEIIVKEDLAPDDVEIRRLAREHKLKKIGFQEDMVSLIRYQKMVEHVGKSRLVALRDVVRDLRSIKDEDEIRTTRKAVRIAERAFRDLIGQGGDYLHGRTELQLAAELEYRMRMAGADRQGFPFTGIIVAAGPNSASAHHFPTRRKVRRGEVVLFDWGAEVDGYRSDITRVVFVGQPHPKLREIYEIVRRAHAAAIAALRPGVRTHAVDKTARDLITDAGYGHLFRHGLGHGIGLEIHEHPFMRRTNVPLKKNMIVTIEPGIYIQGLGGVRLENDVLITADGHKDLNTLATAIDRVIV